MQVAELFERAKQHTGNHSLTAEALGVNPQRVNDWKSGYRPCPAEVQDRLCVLACLSDAEIAEHVIARAGLPRKKTAGSVSGFVYLLATAYAASAAGLGALGSATMYRPERRQGERRREQSSNCQLVLS